MKKPITIGVIAVIVAILITSAVDYSADAVKPLPPPPAPEVTKITALTFSSDSTGEAIFNGGSPSGDEFFNVGTFCDT